MITERMTFDELQNEIQCDMEEVRNKSLSEFRLKALRRASMKRKHDIVYTWFFVNTSRRNRYACILSVNGWNNFKAGKIHQYYVAIYDTDRGKYAVTRVHAKDLAFESRFVCRYQPHFFSRYAERTGLSLTGEDLILHYFVRNNLACMHIDPLKRNENEFFSASTDGLALGYRDGNNVKFNTFIPYDDLGETKYELSKEEVKYLHEMMIDKFGGILEYEPINNKEYYGKN